MYDPVAVVQVGNALLQVFHVQTDQPGAHVKAGYTFANMQVYPLLMDFSGALYFQFGAVPLYLNALAWKN